MRSAGEEEGAVEDGMNSDEEMSKRKNKIRNSSWTLAARKAV